MSRAREDLLQAAIAQGLVPATASAPEAVDALEHARALALQGRVPLEALYRAWASELGLPYADLQRWRTAPEVAARLPRTLLRRSRLLPLLDEQGEPALATGDPSDRSAFEAARRSLGGRCRLAVLEPESLQRLLAGLLAEGPAAPGLVDAPALLDRLLLEAYLRRASDIHLEPEPEGLRVRMRTDGVLQLVLEGLGRAERMALVSRVKVLAALDIAEQRLPQDGSFRHVPPFLPGRALEVRVASLPTELGERLTLRLLGVDDLEARLSELGLEPDDLELLRSTVQRSSGLVLIAGPTGSGKTTTLYAALAELDRRARNVLTVEDPIERRLASISQVRVGGGEKVTFAGVLRAFLRHDPDVILVGEIRDAETADAALKASMTGHLVLSTVHTATAAGALDRLRDLGAEPYRIAAALKLVVAQRLVRRLCSACRTTRPASESERAFLGGVETVAATRGCPRCLGTGSHGRLGLFELLSIDRELAAAIAAGGSGPQIEALAGPRLRSLEDDARRKGLAGRIAVRDGMEAALDR